MSIREMILPGVFLTSVHSDKFKTGCMSVSLLRPLCREEASANALIPTVLLRGCRSCPDMSSISAFLDSHYGASVGTLVRKKGEVQAVGFYTDFLEEAMTLDHEPVLGPMLEFIGDLLLRPVLEDGSFVESYVEGEKLNLTNAIESRINDKKSYAVSQLLKIMCASEAYGVPRLGEKEDVEALDTKSLYAHYQRILTHSQIEIFYLGRRPGTEIGTLLQAVLADLPRGELDPVGTQLVRKTKEMKSCRECMDVTQGKLAMGLRTNCTALDAEYPAMLLMNAVFGSGVTSKLFLNVREKLSLCYYASSSLEKFKGVMVISSGIEFDKYETARDEILRQLNACRDGDVSEEELESARRAILSSLKTGMDSPGRLDDYALGQAILEKTGTMADLAELVKAVTVQQVVEAARRVTLDTEFFLEGEQA